MIKAEFAEYEGKLKGFSVKGHAGFSESPHDIICASVSSMTNLVADTLTEVFKVEAEIICDEKIPLVKLDIVSFGENEDSAVGVLRGFYIELCEMEKQYPKFISVKKIEK